MQSGDKINFKIRGQGAPIVNSAHIYEFSDNIVAIEVDLSSKYCSIDGSFETLEDTCGVYIFANERSIQLSEDIHRNEPVSIEFVDFVGYEVFAYDLGGRFTMRACLTKRRY